MAEDLVIHKIFTQTASRFADSVALQIKKDRQWQKFTYQEINLSALKVGAFLLKEGFRKNEFAALILENRPEWAIIYLGVMYAGLTCVPLDPQLNPQEIQNLILDSGAKILFCSQDIFINKIKQTQSDHLIKIVVLGAKDEPEKNLVRFSAIEHISSQGVIFPEVLPEDIASLIYTSGTTGQPKGVLLSHANLCSNFRGIQKVNIVQSQDNFLSILPLYHTYSFMITLIVPLFIGARVTYCPLGFRPSDLVQMIKEAKITILVGVPQLFSLLYTGIFEKIKHIPAFLRFLLAPLIRKKILSSFGKDLRLLVSGGARLEPRIGYGLNRLGFKVIEGYGLTETSPVAALNLPEKVKFGSVGRPLPGVQIKIYQPDQYGIGGVLIQGPNVMQGYFKQPKLTASVIKESWFYSGDLGYLDKDGYLFITGREKDVIVLSSGKNIYPEDLEEYYIRSPYIKEICILQRRQERFGHLVELLHAVVVPDLEYFRKMNEANIREKIRLEIENLAKDLASYKHIMGFTLIKEGLARTALKKIKRYEIKEQYAQEAFSKSQIEKSVFSEEDRLILGQDIAQKIINYLTRELKKAVYLDNHLEIDLGIDSLTRVELGLGLEAMFSLKVADEFFSGVATVKDLILKISELVNTSSSVSEVAVAKETPKNWTQLLKEIPEKEIIKKIILKPSLLDYLLTWIFKNWFLFILRLFWCLRIEGKNKLPDKTPYLICPNHGSYLDGFVVLSSLPLKRAVNTFFLGYSRIFEHPLVRWVIKMGRLIPIDPNTQLTQAMQAISFALAHQKIVCIFPEGHRSVDENIGEFKKGVGILIKELDIPVVPVYIQGSHRSWPRGSRLPKPYPLKIIFGQARLGKELISQQKESASDDYEAIAGGLREEVLKLVC